MATWNSQTESARLLDVPEATLRSWIKKFRPYVTSRQGPDGRPEYNIERLREIHYLCTDWGKNPVARSLSEIGRELARRYPIEAIDHGITPPPDPDFESLGAGPEPETSVKAPPRWEDALAAMAGLPDVMTALSGEVGSVKDELRALIEISLESTQGARILAELAEQRQLSAEILVRLEQAEEERRRHAHWVRYLNPITLVALLVSLLTPRHAEDDDERNGDGPPTPVVAQRALVAPREGA